MSVAETLQQLEKAIKAKGDESHTRTHRFLHGAPLKESEIAAREEALGVPFPPSYREFLLEYGLFSLGEPDAKVDHLVFKSWPLAAHRTALEEYAEQLECDPTAEAVAEEIGLDEEVVAVLGKILLIGCEGHEDFVGFDTRTRHPKTQECDFTLVLWEDTEIDALAQEETSKCSGRGFDEWLEHHIARRR